MVLDGILWRLVRGNLNFWKDKWLQDEGPLEHLTTSVIPIHLRDISVNSLVDMNGSWDLEEIKDLFLQSVYLKIIAMKTPINTEASDIICWNHSQDGKYSVKQTYLAMRVSDSFLCNDVWKLVCKWRGANRIRFFLWKLVHVRLPTGEWLTSCGITNDNRCSFCSSEGESMNHIFRECLWTVKLWKEISNDYSSTWNESWTLSEWIQHNLSSNQMVHGHRWETMFGIGTRLIWKWRNNIKYNSYTVLQNPKKNIKLEVESTSTALATLSRVRNSSSTDILYIRWHPPDTDWVKLNTDGAMKGETGLASCGGLIRDSEGRWLGGFSASLGMCSAVQAELWGTLIGLNEAWSYGFRKVILEGDSKLVIDALQARKGASFVDQNLFLALRSVLEKDWEVRVRQTCAQTG